MLYLWRSHNLIDQFFSVVVRLKLWLITRTRTSLRIFVQNVLLCKQFCGFRILLIALRHYIFINFRGLKWKFLPVFSWSFSKTYVFVGNHLVFIGAKFNLSLKGLIQLKAFNLSIPLRDQTRSETFWLLLYDFVVITAEIKAGFREEHNLTEKCFFRIECRIHLIYSSQKDYRTDQQYRKKGKVWHPCRQFYTYLYL